MPTQGAIFRHQRTSIPAVGTPADIAAASINGEKAMDKGEVPAAVTLESLVLSRGASAVWAAKTGADVAASTKGGAAMFTPMTTCKQEQQCSIEAVGAALRDIMYLGI